MKEEETEFDVNAFRILSARNKGPYWTTSIVKEKQKFKNSQENRLLSGTKEGKQQTYAADVLRRKRSGVVNLVQQLGCC